jgi:carbonic anhydrase
VEELFAGRPVAAPAVRMDRDPVQRLIVVTCMDARIDPMRALGLEAGDAHIIRNAGVVITDDVLRSIAVSRELMSTEAVLLLGHTGCAAFDSSEACRAQLRESLAQVPGRAAAAFYDLESGRVEPVA